MKSIAVKQLKVPYQTYQNIEVIVVDDGSTDGSWKTISTYSDKVVTIQKENGGQSSAFNAGFAASQGDIICLLGPDDFFSTEKLATIVEVFKEDCEIGWCFHPLRYIEYSSSGEEKFIAYYPSSPSTESVCKLDFRSNITHEAKHPDWGSATSGCCFRRSLLAEIFPIPESIRIESDNYLR